MGASRMDGDAGSVEVLKHLRPQFGTTQMGRVDGPVHDARLLHLLFRDAEISEEAKKRGQPRLGQLVRYPGFRVGLYLGMDFAAIRIALALICAPFCEPQYLRARQLRSAGLEFGLEVKISRSACH
ncbi:hypothetical protein BKK81_19625 [Cupriavidus sp. USMAHM13]|nr:hypothetical protein BKK81_19625 [Cupriavidus sp. USMAHM13]